MRRNSATPGKQCGNKAQEVAASITGNFCALVHKPHYMSRHRNYVFTYNNPPDGWIPEQLYAEGSNRILFLAGQFEVGSSNTRHYQGYVVLCNPTGLPGLRKLLQCPTGHFEPRKGTHRQALEYVHKDETREPGATPQSFGEPPLDEQGRRTDLSGVKEILDGGGNLLAVAESNFGAFIRYQRGLIAYANLITPHRTAAPAAYYFFGPGEFGKSRAAWESFGEPEVIFPVSLAQPNAVWFDGYDPRQHRTVIFDDYYHNYRHSFLLQLLDRYPINVPVKGTYIKFCATTVVFTSNIGLHQQYPNIEDSFPLWRRFRHVVRFDHDRVHLCTRDNPMGF